MKYFYKFFVENTGSDSRTLYDLKVFDIRSFTATVNVAYLDLGI